MPWKGLSSTLKKGKISKAQKPGDSDYETILKSLFEVGLSKIKWILKIMAEISIFLQNQ